MDDPEVVGVTAEPNLSEELRRPWRRLALAPNEFFTHVVGASIILGIMVFLQSVVFGAPTGQELIFFKGSRAEFNGAWLFDAADVGLIGAFGWTGIAAFWKALRK
jgi:hypothetical protein